MAEEQSTITLPYAGLRGMQLDAAVLALVPLATVERYQVAAFEMNDTVLKLALVHPEQLKQGFFTSLEGIGAKINKKVELYRTDMAGMQNLITQYRALASSGGAPSVSPAVSVQEVAGQVPAKEVVNLSPPPPLFQLGKTVAANYLRRVPLLFARQQRVVCVDFLAPNSYWFATDSPEQKSKLIAQIGKQNAITTYVLPVSKRDLDDLLHYYEEVDRELVKKEKDEAKRIELEHEAALAKRTKDTPQPTGDMAMAPQVPNAPGVIVPELHATIISSEQEKGGIAGIFQRFGQGRSAPKESHEEEKKVAPPPATVILASPITSQTVVVPTSPLPTAAVSPTPPQAGEAVAAPAVAAPAPAPTPAPAPAKPAIAKTAEPAVKNAEDSGDIGKLLNKAMNSIDDLTGVIKEGSIPRIVAAIVSFAIHEKASDIHLEVFQDEVRIRYRVDGQLQDIIKVPPDIHSAMVSRIKILCRLRLDETRVPQDGRFDVNFDDAQVDLRVSVMPTVHGEKVVMRILDKNRGITSLESLGIMGFAYQNILKAIEKPFGVCLATGPTGSGKSTSLYAILKQIATPNVNVVTLEDPVEYEMKGINQSQIRPKIGFTFADGLRAILRQDPNIIMVGEIRDGETANMATQAALTGHLVLSTLHTNDAAGAIPRLQNMGIEPFLITSSLNVAIGQRLVRKICQSCKSPVNLPQGIRDQFAKDIDIVRNLNPIDSARIPSEVTFYQGTGCSVCGGKGYQGRLGIYEVLTMSEAIEGLALKRASGGQIQEQAQKEGMLTMYQDGLLKVVSGLTTLDEVLRETSSK